MTNERDRNPDLPEAFTSHNAGELARSDPRRLTEQLMNLEDLPASVADALLASGEEWVMRMTLRNKESFVDFDVPSRAEILFAAGKGYLLAEHLNDFPEEQRMVVALRIIQEGKGVSSFFESLPGDTDLDVFSLLKEAVTDERTQRDAAENWYRLDPERRLELAKLLIDNSGAFAVAYRAKELEGSRHEIALYLVEKGEGKWVLKFIYNFDPLPGEITIALFRAGFASEIDLGQKTQDSSRKGGTKKNRYDLPEEYLRESKELGVGPEELWAAQDRIKRETTSLQGEERYKKIYEILRSTKELQVWQDQERVVDPFERGATVFGYEGMLKFSQRNAMPRQEALEQMDKIIVLQRASGLTAEDFYDRILAQVAADTGQYGQGKEALNANALLNEMAATMDVDFRGTLQEMRSMSHREILGGVDMFSGPEEIFSSWNELRRYYGALRVLAENRNKILLSGAELRRLPGGKVPPRKQLEASAGQQEPVESETDASGKYEVVMDDAGNMVLPLEDRLAIQEGRCSTRIVSDYGIVRIAEGTRTPFRIFLDEAGERRKEIGRAAGGDFWDAVMADPDLLLDNAILKTAATLQEMAPDFILREGDKGPNELLREIMSLPPEKKAELVQGLPPERIGFLAMFVAEAAAWKEDFSSVPEEAFNDPAFASLCRNVEDGYIRSSAEQARSTLKAIIQRYFDPSGERQKERLKSPLAHAAEAAPSDPRLSLEIPAKKWEEIRTTSSGFLLDLGPEQTKLRCGDKVEIASGDEKKVALVMSEFHPGITKSISLIWPESLDIDISKDHFDFSQLVHRLDMPVQPIENTEQAVAEVIRRMALESGTDFSAAQEEFRSAMRGLETMNDNEFLTHFSGNSRFADQFRERQKPVFIRVAREMAGKNLREYFMVRVAYERILNMGPEPSAGQEPEVNVIDPDGQVIVNTDPLRTARQILDQRLRVVGRYVSDAIEATKSRVGYD